MILRMVLILWVAFIQTFIQVSLAEESRFHFEHFSELMSPSFRSGTGELSVPSSDGGTFAPVNVTSYTWLSYDLTDKWSVVYWQNTELDFNSIPDGEPDENSLTVSRVGSSMRLFDPRFALRNTLDFGFNGWSLTTDFFLEPGVTDESRESYRQMGVGIRNVFNAPLQSSRFTLGVALEHTFGVYGSDATEINTLRGSVNPSVSYNFNDTFSTQHYVFLPYTLTQGAEGTSRWAWDMGGLPFVQNGIGANLAEGLSVTLMLNQYIGAPLTLKNTWASLWFNWIPL